MIEAILGIDVSKKDLSIALFVKGSFKRRKFSNNLNGFKELTDWLKKEQVTRVKACLEATGRYGEEVSDYLYNQGHQVHVVNPVCIKAFAKSKLSRHKTDEVDALLIAEYASKNELRPYKPKDPVLKELQGLYRCSQSLKDQKTQVINLLENEHCLPNVVQEVYNNLKDQIEKQIQTLEAALDLLVANQDELKLDIENIQTVPGIGKMTAIAILAQAPDLSSFENARQLAAYAGLTPCHKTSGTSVKGRSRLSKMGSSSLRKALYFPAIVAKNHNPLLKAFAQKLTKKGKHTMVIIAAIMRKLLHIVFGIIKHKTPFNPDLLQNVS
jgi:transposase